jgi:ribosome-binding factor A
MISRSLRNIKHAQRESYYFRELSSLVQQIIAEDTSISDLVMTRVSLSPSRGSLTLFIGTLNPVDQETFDKKLRQLVLYKPSIRAALAKVSTTRYTPEIIFKFDTHLEKQHRMDQLFAMIRTSDEE